MQARAQLDKVTDRLADTDDDSSLTAEHDDAAEPIIIDDDEEDYESADSQADVPKGEQCVRCVMALGVHSICMSAFCKHIFSSVKVLTER